MNRTRFAVAIAVASVACVNVPDSIKGTFAPRQGSETDNFSSSAPHAVAPPELTQATVAIADASTSLPPREASIIGMCPRETAPMSTTSNCLSDAGDQ